MCEIKFYIITSGAKYSVNIYLFHEVISSKKMAIDKKNMRFPFT